MIMFRYGGQYLLAPGGRSDVIVKCASFGVYEVVSSESDAPDAELVNIGRVPTGQVLFKLQVNAVGADTVTQVPAAYPARPAYLADLRGASTGECGCNTYFNELTDRRVVTWGDTECGFVFNTKDNHNINLVQFGGAETQPMTVSWFVRCSRPPTSIANMCLLLHSLWSLGSRTSLC